MLTDGGACGRKVFTDGGPSCVSYRADGRVVALDGRFKAGILTLSCGLYP